MEKLCNFRFNIMMYNNNFNKDNHSFRSFRLQKLSNSVVDYTFGMSIPVDLLDWTVNSYNIEKNCYNNMDFARMDLKLAKYNLDDADKLLLKSYQKCKMILVSRFHNDVRLKLFGVGGVTPREHNNLVVAADIMLKAIADYETETGTEIVPQVFKNALQAAMEDSVQKSYKIGGFAENYLKLKMLYEENFAADNAKLRALYNLVISYQGRENTGLPIIGFAIDNKKRGRKRKKKSEQEDE